MNRSEGFKTVHDGAELFTRRWEPDGPTKGVIALLHGVAEHSGRYEGAAEHFTDAGYVVSAFDLRGHGRSKGRRGDCRLDPTFRDIDELLDDARDRASGRPVFLYGHSLGGLIALAYGLDRKPELAGVIASGPALKSALTDQRAKVFMARLLGGRFPTVSVPLGLDATLLSRDPAVVEDYLNDPLVNKRGSFGLAHDVLIAQDRVLKDVRNFPLPLLLIHGGADRVNYVSGSEIVATEMGDRCTFRVYEGIFHQPHTDPESKRVLDEVVEWFDRLIPTA
jgi:alpha-beta hydrolase superfamily lysophospholipase